MLKRLKDIEDKTDNQLKENKHNQLGIESIGYAIKEGLSQGRNMFEKISNQEKLIDHKKLYFRGGNDYDFTNFSFLEQFIMEKF